jgi:tetratricopeptide (TPR) repeat protein
MEISFAAFENTWARTQHWAMVAVAPGRLPVTAEADRHALAAAALERVHPGAALAAYETGLQAWPAHRTSLLGAGNAAYAMGQLERAAAAYRLATDRHPDFADAWNNLAQVLLELGQAGQARQAIERAVALGGPRRADYLELQEKISNAPAKSGN